MKIAIAVHGRFIAFDMARELLQRGNDVTLLTNYPGRVVERFGFPRAHVRSFWLHGLAARATLRLHAVLLPSQVEILLHRAFGAWVAGQVRREAWDVVQCWSGIAEESFAALATTQAVRQLVRGSAHIRTQAQLLREEEVRTHTRLEGPSEWMIAREEREYDLADQIIVLSSFSRDSFREQGVPSVKVAVIRPGTPVAQFHPSRDVANRRRDRILAGAPLHVLNVGTQSLRKGLWDTRVMAADLKCDPFEFRLVGPVAAEAQPLMHQMGPSVSITAKQPERNLPATYEWADLFFLPTIEDGYPAVMAQALAAGLPLVSTTNGAAHDIIVEGQNGWVLPIRSPYDFVERLRWCATHREEFAAMTERVYEMDTPWNWSDSAAQLEKVCSSAKPNCFDRHA